MDIFMYLRLPFVQYAFIAGILIAICASLLGVILVLKRYSFIGDGLSHVAFGTMAVAGITGLTNNMFIVMPVTIICAILLLVFDGKGKLKGDAIVAMVSVSSLAIGYLLMNVFAVSANVSGDVCSSLFGSISILTLDKADVIVCAVCSVAVVLTFVLFYNRIFSTVFDEPFSRATGTKTNIYSTIIAVMTAVVIVLAMNLVGSLLTSALIIFPALSAMQIFKSFKSVTIFSVIFSVICTTLGLIISIIAGTPVGATIVAIDLIAFVIITILSKILKGRRV